MTLLPDANLEPSSIPPAWEREPEKVLAAVMQSIAAAPQSVTLYALAAGLLTRLGRRDEAASLIETAQNAYPDLPLYRDKDFRLLQRRAQDRGLPAVLLSTQFKSGSVYIASTLRQGLGLPHCYVTRTPIDERIVPAWLDLFAKGGALAQEHLAAGTEAFGQLIRAGIGRMVAHIRDPRQSLLSAVHYRAGLFNATTAGALVARAGLPDDYAGWSLARRLDHYLDDGYAAQVEWTAGWLAAARTPPAGLDVLLLDYGLLHDDPVDYFRRLLQFYGIAETAFDGSVLAGRPAPGTMHFRTGTTDEWRKSLNPEQQRRASAMLPAIVADYFGA